MADIIALQLACMCLVILFYWVVFMLSSMRQRDEDLELMGKLTEKLNESIEIIKELKS